MTRTGTFAVVLTLFALIGCSREPVKPGHNGAPDDLASETVSPEASDVDGAWGLPLKGLFTYMADAAVFESCATGWRLPVAMEADYLSAERAYLESRTEPGAPLLVTLVGHIARRPPMEGNDLVEMLVIGRFDSTHPGEDCE